jgi:glycosyltransferase involved in cell wall biosynthesis
MKKLPITVAMIAGAEAPRIGRALESVTEWAGEIVLVLNAEVDDGTDQIAVSHGAKVFREPWKGHVAQKNSAAAKATQPWILGLDADEVVSSELREEIVHLFSLAGTARDGVAYCFPRCTFYLGRWVRHGDWYPDRQTRLWQRGRAEWGGNDPHDKLIVGGSVGRLNGELLHYSMASLDQQLGKIALYSNYFAQRWSAQGRKPGWLDLSVRPLWRFLRCYVVRLGFLDGWVGFYLSWQTAFACLTRYAKVREAMLPPPASSITPSCSTSPSSSSPVTPAR